MHQSLMIVRWFSLLALLFVFFAPAAHADIRELDSAGLQKLLDSGVAVVDVRRPDEWRQTGVVKGSHLATFFHDKEYKVYDVQAWLNAFAKVVPKDKPVILICRTGSRTRLISKLLSQQGYAEVYNVNKGIVRWIRDGKPVASWQ
jgi:rhodanese-related sulfurtransferase